MLTRPNPPAEKDLRTARIEMAAETAVLPVIPEIAWTVPQLLKRARLIAPGVRSTTGVLRTLIRMPEQDEQFLRAFTESGFLTSDRVLERVRWRYDVDAMAARFRGSSDSQVLAHCRSLLAGGAPDEALDWEEVLLELRTLKAWFPELRTIDELARLYERLHALHVQSVHVARRWLDRGAGRCLKPIEE